MPIKFTSQTLKSNELNYNITEKEILALLRVLNECHNMLVGKTIRVLTRHTTLGWLFRSKGLQGCLSQWAAILSPWRLEIIRSAKGEEAIVISFDGSARVKREGAAFSVVVWQLSNRNVVKAASGYAEGLTVNEGEYRGESPGNIIATYPFQVIAMDHIPSLPRHTKETRSFAESYEEAVFRRFGDSEAIRHDQEPGFMSDFFRAFKKHMGQRQRTTLAYRPQENGAAERMVQTITRVIKMYIADIDQRDWDEYTERLTYALNTAHGRTRDETPFFLVRDWDPRSTLETTLAIGNTSRRDADARRWRMHIQRHYKTARAQALEPIREAVNARTTRQNARDGTRDTTRIPSLAVS
ncbi:reverse transcriptase [Phytophthora megakarya]|uniref:Reverse transcriptase n=1 Tax=Phytophthora megakarya TaxID=4795 RepID=A0A225VWY5_9STRA|nr:reverse transcriptase [Phytophthora megakarya]